MDYINMFNHYCWPPPPSFSSDNTTTDICDVVFDILQIHGSAQTENDNASDTNATHIRKNVIWLAMEPENTLEYQKESRDESPN